MKVIISGPRRLPSRDNPRDPWPHLHVKLDMAELPAVGEHITLNSGSGFTVRRRFFYVEGPETSAYYGWDSDYDTDQGTFDVVYLDVLPDGYDEPFTYDKAIAEGTVRGHEQAAAEVEKLLNLLARPSVDPVSAIAALRAWCIDGAAQARQRAELAERHAAFADEIMAGLQAEREITGQED
jgi:hypothetical protein